MTVRDLLEQIGQLGKIHAQTPVVFISDDDGSTTEIEGLIVEDGQVKLISG